MATVNPDHLSPFGRLAVKLDGDFSELIRLGKQMQKLDLESESGLERAVKLLDQFARHGKDITTGMQDFARALQEARDQSDATARIIAECAGEISRRKQDQLQMREKLSLVEHNVQGANAHLSVFKNDGKELSNEDRQKLKAQLERLNIDLKKYLSDAQAVKAEAGQAKFRSIERDAQILIDALRSSTRKVDKIDGN